MFTKLAYTNERNILLTQLIRDMLHTQTESTLLLPQTTTVVIAYGGVDLLRRLYAY